jgi:hypothetical protein
MYTFWQYRDMKIKTIALSGGSGLIGQHLKQKLEQQGVRVFSLVRHPPKPEADEIYFNPDEMKLDTAKLEGMDAIIHLGGPSIAQRWTPAYKAYMLRNRRNGARLIRNACSTLNRPPQCVIIASAIGYYGFPQNVADETFGSGYGFAAELCRTIETPAEDDPALPDSTRLVYARFGVVMSKRGGALAKMLPAFCLGMGGQLGNGTQMMSWVSLHDTLRAIEFVLDTDALNGPVNITAPEAVTNSTFTQTLGKVLRRPALLPMPAWAVKLLFGQMGDELLLKGAKVLPTRLVQSDFTFQQPDIESGLRSTLA